MSIQIKFIFVSVITILLLIVACGNTSTVPKATFELSHQDSNILTYIVDPQKGKLAFYLNDENGSNFGNHKKLKDWLALKNEKLIFAVNGGMYNKDRTPQGLYIENGKVIKEIESQEKGYGNFYLQPNGVFYLDNNNVPSIIPTTKFQSSPQIKYATQSGPMLVVDGAIHSKFNDGSPNVHIRNGVGILPNGQLLFAMSKEKINFYSFAKFFQQNGCKNALYLDGFVSRTFLPAKEWVQEDGNFGVIIGETE